MTPADDSDADVALSSEELAALREVLGDEVRFAIVFGSAGRSASDPDDVDLAVEFTDCRPTDDGYSRRYLALRSALEDELDHEIDLVDVHSMAPQFASVVFDEGVRVLGTAGRQRVLENRLAGERPSVDDARERVAAAVDRLQEGSS